MIYKGVLVFLSLFLWICLMPASALDLAKDGRSSYSIYIPANASPTVKNAANEFAKYFFKISGANLPVTTKFSGNNQIVVGDNVITGKYFPQFNAASLKGDGTYLKSSKSLLFINGGNERGVLNAVYSFFETYLNCRYYAHDLIVIPKQANVSIGVVNLSEVPVISYRSCNYGEALQADYIAWNKISNLPNEHRQKRYKWGLWAHTFTILVPPKKYFKAHPEYYGLINNKRNKNQLCLSRDGVVDVIVDTLRVMMAKNPDAKYWSVSAMDGNPDNCNCELCTSYRAQNHNQSDLLINFINKIAAKFPNKVISTLAYQKTRTPPISVIPAKNVNIHFCASNDDKLKPITSNPELMGDLNGWLKFTNNIIFRDYMIYYKCDCPFPNFPVLKPNLQAIAAKNIDMVYLEADAKMGLELEELRSYLLAKLMWNPSADAEAITDEFLKAYYHNGAPFVKQYLNTLATYAKTGNRPLQNSARILTYSRVDDQAAYLNPLKTGIYSDILRKGVAAASGDTAAQARINRVLNTINNVTIKPPSRPSRKALLDD